MIQFIYSINDNKAQAYLPPFFLHNKNIAIRHFADCVKDKNHQFAKNPEDYSLWEIGEFDDNTGEIKYYSPHHALGTGMDYIPDNVIPITQEQK